MATQEHRRPPARPPPPSTSSHTPGATSSVQNLEANINTFRDLQTVHDNAYSLVHNGLQADEQGDKNVAMDCYKRGLQLLDKALRANCETLSNCTREQIDQAKDMQMKMNKTRQQIAYRLQSHQAEQMDAANQQAYAEASAPPSYEEAMSEPPCTPPAYYSDDELTALGESLMQREISSSHLANASDLFTIEDGVQIFYISPDGLVSAPSYPTSLHIVRLENEPRTQGPTGETPPAFLHVGDWMYPLVPGTSPVLRTNYGAYIFPDMMAPQPGYSVGLMIPETLPAAQHEKFVNMIRSFAVLGEQTPEPSPSTEQKVPAVQERGEEEEEPTEEEAPLDTAGKISKGIQVATDWIAWGVEKGAEKAGELLKKGSEKLREKTKPGDRPRPVDPKVQKGVIYARQATHGAVKVTGYIVNKLGEVTVALAKEVAPHVKKQGMKVLPRSLSKRGSHGKSTLDGVVEVAATSLKGFGTVYLSLEGAAKSLGRSLTNETVHVVTHKYGTEAGTFTENTMYTTGNVFMTAHGARNLGLKAIAKRAGVETGKAVIEDLNQNQAKTKCPEKGAAAHGDCNKTRSKQPPEQGPGSKQ